MQLTLSNLITLLFATALGARSLAVPRSGIGWLLLGIAVSSMLFLVLAISIPRDVLTHRNLLCNAYLLFGSMALIGFVSATGSVLHPPKVNTGALGSQFDGLEWTISFVSSILAAGFFSLLTALAGLWIKRKDHLPNAHVYIPATASGLVLLCWALSSLAVAASQII